MSDRFLVKGFIADPESFPPIIEIFKFNPTEIRDSKSPKYTEIDVPGLNYPNIHWTGGGPRNISFELFLDGYEQAKSPIGVPLLDGGIRPNVAALSRFLYPKGGSVDLGALFSRDIGKAISFSNENQFVRPPKAILCLGQTVLDVIFRKMDFQFTMFNSKLDPVRAKVDVQATVLEFTPFAKFDGYLRTSLSVLNIAGTFSDLSKNSQANSGRG